MRVTIIGYEIAGEATAKALRGLGHVVQVVDRRPGYQARALADGFPSSLIRPDITFICSPAAASFEEYQGGPSFRGILASHPGVVAVRCPAPGGLFATPDGDRIAIVPWNGWSEEEFEHGGGAPVLIGAQCAETARLVQDLWPPGAARIVRPVQAEAVTLAQGDVR